MTTAATSLEMASAAACSSVDRNHQPHTANAEEEENDMRMLQDPPSTTGDEEHDMAPWIKVTSRAIRRKTRASLATQTLNLSPPKPALRPSRPVLKIQTSPPSCRRLQIGDPASQWSRGVETKCFLYKRTVAYCYVCHQTGHRADVCPYPPDVPTCKDCEALFTAERHECKPKCSLCSGEHRTASKACPGRFLPPVNRRKERTSIGRRRSRTPSGQRGDPSSRSSTARSRSRSRSYPRLPQDRRRRSSRSRSRSKTRGRTPSTQERIETQQSTQ
ncbi:hypothetical protein HPB47_026092, partial [Ixodes persulcatus]